MPAEETRRVFTFEGTFDLLAARRLAAVVVAAGPEEFMDVNVTRVREFQDFAFAVFAKALAESRAHVAVTGLRLHQVRLLRYFGVVPRANVNATLEDGEVHS